jgi:hypothetical protein
MVRLLLKLRISLRSEDRKVSLQDWKGDAFTFISDGGHIMAFLKNAPPPHLTICPARVTVIGPQIKLQIVTKRLKVNA